MTAIESGFSAVLDASWRGGCLVLVLAALGPLLRGRVPSRLLFAAWIVCAVRLLVPLSIPAAWSPFNLVRTMAPSAIGPAEGPPSAAPQLSAAAANRAEEALAAPLPAAAELRSLSLPTLAAGVWAVGVAILVVLRLAAGRRFSRRIRASRGVPPPVLAAVVAQVAAELGSRPVELALTDAIAVPAVAGLFRPMLLFPYGFAERLKPEELRCIIAHELGHSRYGDLASLTLLRTAAILHWFNPLAWMAVRRARCDCEAACDEFVLARLSGTPERYGEILLKAAQLAGSGGAAAPILAIIDSKKQVTRRIKMIACYQKITGRRIACGGALLLLGLAAGFTREVRAEAPAPDPAPTTTAPEGWWKNGSRPSDYVVGVDRSRAHDGHPSAYVRSLQPQIDGFGGMMQECQVGRFQGRRIRYTAWVLTEGANDGGGHLWLRIDGEQEEAMEGFDNMDNRPIKGTTDWRQYSLVLDVPADAVDLAYGFFIAGTGQMLVSGVQLEEVGPDVPTTNLIKSVRPAQPKLPKDPVNLDFATVPTVHLRMIELKRRVGETDTQLVARANQIVARFRAGESFAALARIYTEDGRATKAGDWGWIKPADLKPEFGRYVFALLPGDISAPKLDPDLKNLCFLFYADNSGT